MIQNTFAVVAATFLLAGCGKPDVRRAFAQCESEAYQKIGLQPEQKAPNQYLEAKKELVRVCLVQQGYKAKGGFDRTSHSLKVREEIHNSYGTFTTPRSDIEPQTRKAIEDEIERQMLLFDLRAENWSS